MSVWEEVSHTWTWLTYQCAPTKECCFLSLSSHQLALTPQLRWGIGPPCPIAEDLRQDQESSNSTGDRRPQLSWVHMHSNHVMFRSQPFRGYLSILWLLKKSFCPLSHDALWALGMGFEIDASITAEYCCHLGSGFWTNYWINYWICSKGNFLCGGALQMWNGVPNASLYILLSLKASPYTGELQLNYYNLILEVVLSQSQKSQCSLYLIHCNNWTAFTQLPSFLCHIQFSGYK